MARGCALIDSRLDTAKIGSDGRVEVHRARLLAVFGGTKNVSTRPGPIAEVALKVRNSLMRTKSAACLSSYPRGGGYVQHGIALLRHHGVCLSHCHAGNRRGG